MTVSIVCSPYPTRFPSVTRVRLTRPLIGARIFVYRRFNSADSRAALAWARAASACPTAARAVLWVATTWSYSSRLTPPPVIFSYRVRVACDRSNSAAARLWSAAAFPSAAFDSSRATRYSSGSMSYSGVPCSISVPSRKWIFRRRPLTCGRTSTRWTASRWPVYSPQSATDRTTGRLTVTFGGGARRPAAWPAGSRPRRRGGRPHRRRFAGETGGAWDGLCG